MEFKNILEVHNVDALIDELAAHGLTELVEIIENEDVITPTATSGIPVITVSGEAPPPADDGR